MRALIGLAGLAQGIKCGEELQLYLDLARLIRNLA